MGQFMQQSHEIFIFSHKLGLPAYFGSFRVLLTLYMFPNDSGIYEERTNMRHQKSRFCGKDRKFRFHFLFIAMQYPIYYMKIEKQNDNYHFETMNKYLNLYLTHE